jgi:hypothetical protein
VKFEISINGIVRGVAESTELGVLSAILSYVHVPRDPKYFSAEEISDADSKGELYSDGLNLHVGGLDSTGEVSESKAHFDVLNETVAIGDVISIKILG